jgi:hypothetical protein
LGIDISFAKIAFSDMSTTNHDTIGTIAEGTHD